MARGTLPVALGLMFGHEGDYVNTKTDRASNMMNGRLSLTKIHKKWIC